MNRPEENIVGKRYNRLVVIERVGRDKWGKWLYKCLCDCQVDKPEDERKYVITTKSNLERHYQSCGCLHDELSAQRGKQNRKPNRYNLDTYDYAVGYCHKNDYPFYFDKEDYDLISQYTWYKHQDGYLRTCTGQRIDENGKKHNQYIMMHQLLQQHYYPDSIKEMDHINGKTNDNRKCNLRETTRSQNSQNTKIYANNKSGIRGVYELNGKWKAHITFQGQQIHLGTFNTKEEAAAVRLQKEKELFGEYNRRTEEDLPYAV